MHENSPSQFLPENGDNYLKALTTLFYFFSLYRVLTNTTRFSRVLWLSLFQKEFPWFFARAKSNFHILK